MRGYEAALRFFYRGLRSCYEADFPLSKAFPKLEQLWIGPFVPYLNPNLIRDTMWPHLKVLVFDSRTYIISETYDEESRSVLRFMSGLKSLQYISLESTDGNYCPCIFSGSYDVISDRNLKQYSEFQNLRAFQSRTMCISPEGAQTLLPDAIASEQLTSFSIVFPYIPDPDSEGSSTDNEGPSTDNEHTSFLKGYEWFRGTPSIHTLGCYDFNFLSPTRKARDKPLRQFLASFPNLRTLSIGSRS